MADVFWTSQAQEDLREIKRFIARDAPRTAQAFVDRLRNSAGRLHQFPESGGVVLEIGNPQIRELSYGHYRLIYRYKDGRIDILTVFHSARILTQGDL